MNGKKTIFEKNLNLHNSNILKEVLEENCGDILLQHILNL
jgi:hypothetical protein